MDIKAALALLVQGSDLSRSDMAVVMHQVMGGEATDAQIGALLMGLRAKPETAEELAGAAQVMRELATPVLCSRNNKLTDLVGTGGDGANLFNVSTAATFVASAAGVPMAKHGNRSVSSTSGSSDVLEALGVPLDLTPEQIGRAIDEVGMGFMFAPAHHSAMRYAVGPRRDLAMRTMFNILGPMTNPAGVKRQVIGVFAPDLCPLMAQVMQLLGSEHVLIVHSDDGLDELSIAADSQVSELRNGNIESYTVAPEDLGCERASLDGLNVSGAQESAQLIADIFANREDARVQKAKRLVALNAGSAIYVGGVAASLAEGFALADDVIASGQAAQKLKHFVQFSQLMREAS